MAAALGTDEATILRLAAAVEADSEHPLARAIVAAAAVDGGDVPIGDGTSGRSTGRGVEATSAARHVAVGGPALLRERGSSRSLTRWRRTPPSGAIAGPPCST